MVEAVIATLYAFAWLVSWRAVNDEHARVSAPPPPPPRPVQLVRVVRLLATDDWGNPTFHLQYVSEEPAPA